MTLPGRRDEMGRRIEAKGTGPLGGLTKADGVEHFIHDSLSRLISDAGCTVTVQEKTSASIRLMIQGDPEKAVEEFNLVVELIDTYARGSKLAIQEQTVDVDTRTANRVYREQF